METEIEKAIDAVRFEIVQINLIQDPTDPEISAKLCAQNCKLYSLLTMLAQHRGEMKIAGDYAKQHEDWEKRRGQAEMIRKNRLLPQILAKLDAWQSGASEIKDRANSPIFSAADEEI